jgi:putative phage-type endonuclease
MNLDDHIFDFDTFDRASGLGGTDAAAIMGLHPYKTALDVYLNKHGEGAPFKMNDAVMMGNKLEPIVADLYYERRGLASDARGLKMYTPGTIRHPDHPWAYGSPDRILFDQKEGRWFWGLEVKTTGIRSEHRWGETESNKYPQEHLLQCVWYMWITRAMCKLQGFDPIQHWDLCVLITGQEFRHYRIHHDQEIEDQLVEAAREFWHDSIKGNSPPDPVSRDSSNLVRLWPKDEGYMLEANEDQQKLIRQYQVIDSQIKELETQRDEVKTAIKCIIGDASGIEADWFSITWKARKQSRRTDYKGLIKAINPALELIDQYTKLNAAQRPFLAKFKGADNE